MKSWYEIPGFSSPGEFERFEMYLATQIEQGLAREIPVDPDYGPGEIFGGSWYLNIETQETWRLVPPDPPFTGLWERVARLDERPD